MPTRLKRPSLWRPLAVTAVLCAFQGYLGYNVLRGQFGIESQKQMALDIDELQQKSASLKADVDAFRHRVELFSPAKLDPDILTERARALLNMAQVDDLLVMVDPRTGLPASGSPADLAENQLSSIIATQSAR